MRQKQKNGGGGSPWSGGKPGAGAKKLVKKAPVKAVEKFEEILDELEEEDQDEDEPRRDRCGCW